MSLSLIIRVSHPSWTSTGFGLAGVRISMAIGAFLLEAAGIGRRACLRTTNSAT
jgi:hypothetical protein